MHASGVTLNLRRWEEMISIENGIFIGCMLLILFIYLAIIAEFHEYDKERKKDETEKRIKEGGKRHDLYRSSRKRGRF